MSVHTVGGYNFYTITGNDKKYIIGGVPYSLKDSYIAEACDASAIILLTSNPEFVGGVAEVVAQNPDIAVYATSAGLRNIKEIINRDINEKLIKDSMQLDGMKFIITPGLPWVDTVSVIYNRKLFSGELFSGDANYYSERLKINRGFVVSALETLCSEEFSEILPAVGNIIEEKSKAFEDYYELTAENEVSGTRIAIVYSSVFGYTKTIAQYMQSKLSEKADVYFADAKNADIETINASDIIIIGTNTVNRNAPKEIWDVITRLDLTNKRGTPYFVFGSFGWAGDGIKLIDKTLNAMGMKQIAKPLEVLFAPSENDIKDAEKAVKKVLEHCI